MRVALKTRGFEQQLDYNVIDRCAPFGVELHKRMAALSRARTTESDYDFSFVVRSSGGMWEILVSCIASERCDFSGSPLRTDVYLSGTGQDAEGIDLAKRILLSEISEHRPTASRRVTAFGSLLDSVLTNDVVKRLVGWNGAEKLDAGDWVVRQLLPVIGKLQFRPETDGCPWIKEFGDRLDALLAIPDRDDKITGELLPYIPGSDTDERNLTLHYSSGSVRIRENDSVEQVKKKPQPPSAPPLRSLPPQPPPPPALPRQRLVLAMLAISAFVVIALMRGCGTSSEPSSETSGRDGICAGSATNGATAVTDPTIIKKGK